MKQKLLNSIRLRVCMLVAVMCAAFAGQAWGDTTYKLTKVTSVSAGNKYVFEQNSHVLNNTVSSSALQTTGTYSTTGLAGTESYIWELESATGGFYLKNVSLNSNQYLNNTSGKTNMTFGSKSSIWTIAFTDGVALISNKSNSNRYLGDSGDTTPANTYKAYATSNLPDKYPHDFTVYLVEEESTPANISIETSDVNLNIGETNTRTATSLTDGATISYSSNATGVATVNPSTGEVTAVSEGSATITATASAEGYSDATASYTVNVSDTRAQVNILTFTATNTTLIVGGSPNSTATSVTNNQGGWTAAYTYSSDDTDVATVNSSGVITAVGKGTATITCSLNVNPSDKNYRAGTTTSKSIEITVTKKPSTVVLNTSGITNTDVNTSTVAGSISASVVDANEEEIDGATVTWTSSDTDVATIVAETGVITLVGEGETTLTATYAGSGDYESSSNTYVLTVIDSTPVIPFELVTNVSQLEEGDIVTLVNESAGVAIGAQKPNNFGQVGVSITDHAFRIKANNTTMTKFTMKPVSSSTNWYFQIDESNYLAAKSSSSNNMGTATFGENDAKASISISEGNATITFQGSSTRNLIQYNSSSKLFSCYASSQAVVQIYKKVKYTNTITTTTEYTVDVTKPTPDEGVTFSATATDGTVYYVLKSSTLDAEEYDLTDGVLSVESTSKSGVIVVTAKCDETSTHKAAEDVDITITVVGTKVDPEITVSDDNVTYGDNYELDTSGFASGSVSLESGNTSIATVEGLTITPVACGEVEITVSTAEDEIYKAGSETFVLTVTAPGGSTKAPSAGDVTLFGESFGNNAGSARDWNDSYSVKTGVASVYSGITGYTVSNAKQGKNTTGSTQSGLNQSTAGTDAYIIIGPLDVASYSNMTLSYQWNAGSIKGTYTTSAYYATSSGGEYTEMSGTGDGATTFVTRSYSVPAAAQVSTLYLKIVWNTSNTQAIIDEVQLTTPAKASTTASLNASGYGTFCSVNPMDFSETDGYTAWRISSIEMENETTGTVTCNKITGTIKGGQGVLLYNKDADGVNKTDVTVTFADGTTEFSHSDNLLIGTTAPLYVALDEYFGLSGSNFVPVNPGVVPAGKALLDADDIPDPSLVKSFIFVFNDDATGITETRTATREEVEAIFNLGGQRLQKMQRGVNIVNGKKVLVK